MLQMLTPEGFSIVHHEKVVGLISLFSLGDLIRVNE